MAEEYSNDIEVKQAEAGIAPERPRIRKLNQQEIEQWSKGIHQVCEGPGKNKRGWVPQLRAAYSHLMPFVDEQCDTAYTDCRYRIGISPRFLDPEQTSVEQLAFVILHETMHNTQHHRERLLEKKGLNGKLTNFATDLEINGIIAQGVFGIDLGRPESPANGNWDYLMGEFKQLNDEQARTINTRYVGENGEPLLGREYAGGDWFYQGGLLPKHGDFHDFPTDWTAEQYLGMLEVETEDMTFKEFQERRQKQQQNQQGNPGGNMSGVSGSGQGQGTGSGSGGSGVPSDQDPNGNPQQGGGSGGATQGGSGSGMSPNGGEMSAPDEGVSLPGENNGQGEGEGAGGNQQQPVGSMPNGAGASGSSGAGMPGGPGGAGGPGSADQASGNPMSDGYGGTAEDTGDGHVRVTKIYKRNADGTRTEVGKDALVDDIGMSDEADVWQEASKLGINPISRGEEQKVKEQIAHDIDVYRRTNSWGLGSADMLLSYIERGLRPPMVNWQKALRSAVSRACQEQMKGRDDFTYRRINRRYSQGKFIFPGMTSYVPTIRFALDTSGSMSADEYYNALSEAEGILRLAKAKIEFVCWDGEAGEVQQIKTIKEMKNLIRGGGGTLASSSFTQIAEQKPKERPDVVVCATDGCFDWQELAESLALPEMKKIIPIIVIVYPFTEDNYYAKQGQIREHQDLLRKYHRKAQVLQAWAKK